MPITKRLASSCLIFLFAITAVPTLTAQEYTRGVGVYPGDVKADFSPAMKIDANDVSQSCVAQTRVPVEQLRL